MGEPVPAQGRLADQVSTPLPSSRAQGMAPEQAELPDHIRVIWSGFPAESLRNLEAEAKYDEFEVLPLIVLPD